MLEEDTKEKTPNAGLVACGRDLERKKAKRKNYDASTRMRIRSAAPRGAIRGRARYATSTGGRTEDALAPGGDEGRGRLRKAAGRRCRPVIRGRPNGATRRAGGAASAS